VSGPPPFRKRALPILCLISAFTTTGSTLGILQRIAAQQAQRAVPSERRATTMALLHSSQAM
jgi:hypothetical protein